MSDEHPGIKDVSAKDKKTYFCHPSKHIDITVD